MKAVSGAAFAAGELSVMKLRSREEKFNSKVEANAGFAIGVEHIKAPLRASSPQSIRLRFLGSRRDFAEVSVKASRR